MEKYVYVAIYAITLTFGLFNLKKYNHNLQLKLWLYFLIYSFITEIVADYFIHIIHIRANIVYNSWFLVSSLFYMLFFLSKVKSLKKRKFIIMCLIIFSLYNLISILFFKNYQNDIFKDSFILGQLFVVMSIMIYYTELLKSDSILSIQKSLFFWISIGALIFNIGMIPVLVIAELIDWQGIFNYIILGLNILMSLCFITGFIMSKKEHNF